MGGPAADRGAPFLEGDGLWVVTTKTLCAAYVVERGKVTMCAPILRRRLSYWRTQAVLVQPFC